MELSETGLPTHHTRVERWECDYNDHWNVRFYGRGFQMAAETVAASGGRPNPGAAAVHVRHLRFHQELKVSAPVQIRSAVLEEPGELDGAIVHLLTSGGMLAATALDFPGGSDRLPRLSPTEVSRALPRGIVGPSASEEAEPGTRVTEVELGPIRSEDLDHTGELRFEDVLRHSSTLQHTQFNALGLTPAFAERSRINRMGVEFRVTRGETPEVGAILSGRTWVTDMGEKSIWATSRIIAHGGRTVATIEKCVVTVDLDARRAVPVPEFMRAAWKEGAESG